MLFTKPLIFHNTEPLLFLFICKIKTYLKFKVREENIQPNE